MIKMLNKIDFLSPRYLNITNISSADFDTVQEIKFSNGATYKTSVMSYVKTLLENHPTEEKYVNICSAIYWYNQAANAYFNK